MVVLWVNLCVEILCDRKTLYIPKARVRAGQGRDGVEGARGRTHSVRRGLPMRDGVP